jgi:hypothetical protein
MAYLFVQFSIYMLIAAAIGLFVGYVIWGQEINPSEEGDTSRDKTLRGALDRGSDRLKKLGSQVRDRIENRQTTSAE